MAATAEELAAQADALSDSMSFFKSTYAGKNKSVNEYNDVTTQANQVHSAAKQNQPVSDVKPNPHKGI